MSYSMTGDRGPVNVSLWVIILIIISGSFFSALIPPFQSPDEPAHIMRAYLLGKGKVILDSPQGQYSGGNIDSGLIAYSNAYEGLQGKPHRKLSADELESARTIRWTGLKDFRSISGTGFYFPLSYLPQAIGLSIGELGGLTVDTSYFIARFMSLSSSALILFAAFKTYPVNPLVIALLTLPMSVFQFSSASLDGVSTALAVLSVATFLRIADQKESANSYHFYALACAVTLLATTRIHALPLLVLVGMASIYVQRKKFYYVFVVATLFVLAWTIIAMKTTVGFSNIVGVPTGEVAYSYVKNPLRFFNVFYATLSDDTLIKFYKESFLGVLGWLDTRFNEPIYDKLLTCVSLVGLLSISVKNLKIEWLPRLSIFICAMASVLFIFFALLITWNKHPASLIQGVQGRYFLVPMIMTAYAVSGGIHPADGILRKIALALVIGLSGFTIFGGSRLLAERYYLVDEQPERVSAVLRPSAPLEPNKPIVIAMSKSHIENMRPIRRIGIQFGTYQRRNIGTAELRLRSLNGYEAIIPFDLSNLADNQYMYFDLDSAPYSSGEIVYLTGGGISTWNAYADKENGDVATCLILEYVDGKKQYTRGCPRY
jgi:uncharacterized membrane protein